MGKKGDINFTTHTHIHIQIHRTNHKKHLKEFTLHTPRSVTEKEIFEFLFFFCAKAKSLNKYDFVFFLSLKIKKGSKDFQSFMFALTKFGYISLKK